MNKTKFQFNFLLISYAIILFLALNNIKPILSVLSGLLSVMAPFIYGFVIAYILNRPLNFFEKKIFKIKDKNEKYFKLKKTSALISVYLIVFFIIFFIFFTLIPQLISSINTLVNNIPIYSHTINTFANQLFERFDIENEMSAQLEVFWQDLTTKIGAIISNALPYVISITKSITTGISNIALGFVVSIYLLSSKTKLLRQTYKFIYAFFPKQYIGKLLRVATLANRSFGDFVTGQITDAFIVGTLTFIGMSIFEMPYGLLVSVIVGCTNIIPIFGPIIGAIPSTFIIFMVSPVKAIWFFAFIMILQQIDGNIIYPRVVGTSIGLSGLWVLLAIIIGGGLFGLTGMILGVPIAAVLYSLLSEATNKRLKRNKLDSNAETKEACDTIE